jgi:hypothetical protein
MELEASLSLVVRRKVSLFHKFMVSMSKGTFCLEFAFAIELPVSAHFSSELDLVLLDKVLSFLFTVEVLFRLLHGCCLFIELIRNGSFCRCEYFLFII